MTFWQITLDLLHGFGLTCLLFLLTLILALPLGLGLSFCTMSKWKPVKSGKPGFRMGDPRNPADAVYLHDLLPAGASWQRQHECV